MTESWKVGRRGALVGVVLCAALVGCGEQGEAEAAESLGFSDDPIVDVGQTAVERQSIGNCWIYAHASWIESMHQTASGAAVDLSQSYWTYWHWFDQITGTLS